MEFSSLNRLIYKRPINMPKITEFEDLHCWQNAKKLTVSIYKTRYHLSNERSSLDQFQRASLSIMNNIAEGFTRFSIQEKIRYFEIAQSSAAEVKSMIYLFEELELLDKQTASNLHQQLNHTRHQILKFIKYLKSKKT